MDALGFVMGERAGHLRVKHIKDLIHGAHIGKPAATTASVSMIYCTDEDEELIFSRYILGESSEYRVNGQQVTFAKYTSELEKNGFVVKAKNCLVYQNAVESIAMMNGKERTRMFERISRSGELSSEYDAKQASMQKAKEDTQFHFNRKKSATAEKKQVFKDKTEAEKYQELVEELQESKLEVTLFQLFHNERNIERHSDTLRERQEAGSQHQASLDVLEQAVKSRKKEHGRLGRELQQLEKEIRSQEQILNQQRPQYIKAQVNTSHHEKKAEEARRTLQKTLSQQGKTEQELEELRGELSELERAWKFSERQMEKEAQRGTGIQLNETQMERFKELKELARKRSAVFNQNAENLQWEVKADYEKLQFDLRRKSEIQENIKHSQARLEDFSQRAEKLEDYAHTTNEALKKHHQEEEDLSGELERGRVRQVEVNEELAQVLVKLQNARLDRQENSRQQKRDEVLENLRRRFPDAVCGRLLDLCQPIHPKYQLAVTKVFGKNMNAIVVTNATTAHECIRILKQNQAEPETFLPIDYIDVRPLNERLREVQGAKMLVDVVQCAPNVPMLKQVVQFVCGNSMVCDTLKDARCIAYEGRERLQTVALDGTLFQKSGVISGGSRDLLKKARRWEEKDMSKLSERKVRLMSELQALMKLRRKETELNQIRAQSLGNQTRLKYSNSELESLRKKSIPACHAEISRLRSELSNNEAQVEVQSKSVEQKEKHLKDIQDQIHKMEDVVFADFCADISVDNIREYERDFFKLQQELEEKRLQFESQRTRLTAQMEYEQAQLDKNHKQVKKIEESIQKEKDVILSMKENEDQLILAMEETQSKLQDLNQLLSEQTSAVKVVKAELDNNVKEVQEKNRELGKHQMETISIESALEQLRLAKHNLLLGCKIEGLPFTLISGALDDISDIELDSESPSISTLEIYQREAQIQFDYSTLDHNLKALDTESEVTAELEALRQACSARESLLMTIRPPNLKSLEKLQDVRESFREVMDAFETCAQTCKKSSLEFEQVKAKRFHLFNQFFEHVSISVDEIYKKLCRNVSAQAILSPENSNEPYLDGIDYHCVAPGKRFMAMDNLSGGEKSIAALALIFAIHSFRPAPFFVLDEVDASLDNTNIGKVTSFFREMSQESCQIIVISLKEEFYSQADALIGVYSLFDECMFSQLLTLDLTPYPLNNESDTSKKKDK